MLSMTSSLAGACAVGMPIAANPQEVMAIVSQKADDWIARVLFPVGVSGLPAVTLMFSQAGITNLVAVEMRLYCCTKIIKVGL